MLIKKYRKNNEDGNKEISLYKSSNIFASEFDYDNNELIVIFKRGAKYKYKDVERTDYTRFNIAESQGKELNQLIIPKYDYIREEDVDIDQYQRSVEKAVKEEIEGLEEELYELIGECEIEYSENKTFSKSSINALESTIKTIKEYEQSR